jgi:hypothetical protein
MLQIRAEREHLAVFFAAGQLIDDSDQTSNSTTTQTPVTTTAASCVQLGARMKPPPADAYSIAHLARERREELQRRKQTLRELEEALASAPRLVQ